VLGHFSSTTTTLGSVVKTPIGRDVEREERGVYDSLLYLLSPKLLRVQLGGQTSNSSPMNNFNFSDCRKAVNQATFRPTAARKASAAKLLQEALDFVSSLEEVTDAKPKAKKGRRKTTKRTPSQKVADQMDRAALKTNEVGPIKPSKTARKADVAKAAASAKAVSEHTGAAAKATKRAEAKTEDSRIASLEAKIEALTQCLAVAMESVTPSPANEVSFDELPFEL